MAGDQAYTVLGAGGFIGAALCACLESQGELVHPITRASLPSLLAAGKPVGHVIDCIGLTGDFRWRPFEAAKAHVGVVAQCLAKLRFTSFLLISSTRVYSRATATKEDIPIALLPGDVSDLYSVMKLAGESLCLADSRPSVRVIRLSNVYGLEMPDDTFLGRALREGSRTGSVVFHQSPASTKDYVNIAHVVRMLPSIASAGRRRLYNVAAGRNTSHGTIAYRLSEVAGWQTSFALNAPTVRYLPIDTDRLKDEFGPINCDLSTDMPALLALSQDSQCLPSTRRMAA